MSKPVKGRLGEMMAEEPKKLDPIALPDSLERLLVVFSDEDKDDFAMTIGDLFFRMEQMDTDRWWFQLYKGEQPLFLDDNLVPTRDRAINILISKGMEIISKETK